MDVRRRLVGLLDYVEQVVRLDERVAFQLSEYRLSDGSTFAITKSDTENLPGVRHDIRDDEGGQVWLEIERLARKEPPCPPEDLTEWIVLAPNPEKIPEARPYRLMTVDAARRDEALAKAEVRSDDVLDAFAVSGLSSSRSFRSKRGGAFSGSPRLRGARSTSGSRVRGRSGRPRRFRDDERSSSISSCTRFFNSSR